MCNLNHLLEQNKDWSARMIGRDPEFFTRLSGVQTPRYMWIGCSDSRVPANEIVGLLPGEMFVHRNVANLAVHTDMNLLTVLQYAVEILKVEHVIVCGHYGCGGIRAVVENQRLGLIDNWLRNVRDVYCLNRDRLEQTGNLIERVDLLCELNVAQQVRNVAHTSIVQGAWKRGQNLAIHGWIYGLKDGKVKDLNITYNHIDEIDGEYRL